MALPVGIIGYGAYVPRLRIKSEEISHTWGKNAEQMIAGLGVKEKAIGSMDEDSCTFAVEAALEAVKTSHVNPEKIGAVYVGSESKPYAVKPTATIVAAAIGCGEHYTAADLEFACKAGTAGIQACMGLAASEMIEYGLAIGSDTSQGRPGDALEYSTGGGAAAFIIGTKDPIALINNTYSYSTDTPDFWRRQHEEFPRHAGRYTAEPGYFKHVTAGAKGLMAKVKSKPSDYQYVVFHQPNGKFPVRAAKMLGFTPEQNKQGLITPYIGNTYSGASPIGLASVLDVAKPGDRILVVSYGSGAGSDAFDITVTDAIKKPGRRQTRAVFEQVANKEYITYAQYVKHRGKLKSL